MPELPEVETVRQGLVPAIVGKIIKQAIIRRPDLRWPFPPDMQKRLEGRRVEQIDRRSKYLLFRLDSQDVWLVHLGMSGRFSFQGGTLGQFAHATGGDPKHDHVTLLMDDGVVLNFNDPRRFGAMDIIEAGQESDHKLLCVLGPEPLGNGFNPELLAQSLAMRGSAIKSALLDQKLVAGLGNIYVCEALHRAYIAPNRRCNEIRGSEVLALYHAIIEVLKEAIAAGGSSLRDYRQADGRLGYFQHGFQVYGRSGQMCLRQDCGGVITKIIQSNRSSFYCATCQT